MLWIALAAQLSAPVPTNLPGWFAFDDFPAYLVNRDPGVWAVGIRVIVGPDGAVQGCQVESSSGDSGLDQLSCRKVVQGASFRPAMSPAGTAAPGVYRTYIAWDVTKAPSATSRVSNADLNLSVASLPPGIHSPAAVRVMFAVDAQGRMTSCESEPTQGFEQVEKDPALVAVACDQLMKSYKPVPAKTSAGEPVPSVQDAIVRFSVQSQASR
jgi:TonB family protein